MRRRNNGRNLRNKQKSGIWLKSPYVCKITAYVALAPTATYTPRAAWKGVWLWLSEAFPQWPSAHSDGNKVPATAQP